ncbi:Os03g0735025 [Oryza sativa Japonica Group]|uniref:Os03g0735025 protein n=1 Tax=Oryza sativa subsp. japonica TaxID=39947 RepID=A0A0P0W2P7_ORYSJ|nr:hypothetical protein EE612_020286 [Oryza sativa]BAS86252.1 Os03g0735025 [Oryza sativa Japonica Group]
MHTSELEIVTFFPILAFFKFACILNLCILPDSNRNLSFSQQFSSFQISLIEISTKHYCILEVHIGTYPRTDSNNTVLYPAAIQETSMGND